MDIRIPPVKPLLAPAPSEASASHAPPAVASATPSPGLAPRAPKAIVKPFSKRKLGDAINLQRGFDLPIQKRESGSYPIYSSSGITGYHSIRRCDGPGVITGRYGTIGKVFYSPENYWPLNTTLFVEDFKGNHPKFIYYLLQNLDFESYNDKSAVPGINRNHVHKEMILLPDPTEQRAIAGVLSSLDDKVDLLHRQNKTLEAMAQTLFRQWFVEDIGNNKKSIPVSEIIEFNPSRKLNKGAPAPYLEMSELSVSTFMPSSWFTREFSSGTKFVNGDTLLARITPCLENGKTAFVTFLDEGQVAWGSTEYIIMRPREGIHPLFAYTLARNQDFRDYAIGCLEGSSGRQRVNVDHLMNYEICAPNEKQLEEFTRTAATLIPRLHANFMQIRRLEKLRDTLLPKLMSGEVRVAL